MDRRLSNLHFFKASADRFPALESVVICFVISILLGSTFLLIGRIWIVTWLVTPIVRLLSYCYKVISLAFAKKDQLVVKQHAVVKTKDQEVDQADLDEMLDRNRREFYHQESRFWLDRIRAHRDIVDLACSDNMGHLTPRQLRLFSELASVQKRDNVVAYYAPRPWAETSVELDGLKRQHAEEFKQLLAKFQLERQVAQHAESVSALAFFNLFARLLE